jgi:MFS family permease
VVITVFLLAPALGSAVTSRLVERFGRRGLLAMLLLLSVLLLSLAPVLDLLMAPLDALTIAMRFRADAVVLFPFAVLMGMPFPMAVRLLEERQTASIPVFWGLNGIASVLGSTAAISLALLLGFRTAMLLGVAMYVLTVVVLGAFRRSVRV